MARKKTFDQKELYQATEELMLAVGYDQFSFQLLADKLQITRTALYKYYRNKNVLLNDFLNASLEEVVRRLEAIEWPDSYPQKLDELMAVIFDYADTHAISAMVPTQKWTAENADDPEIQRSRRLHTEFFGFVQRVVEEGQKKGYLKAEIPSALIIETIFHSINLPNRAGISPDVRAVYVKKMLFEGILK